MHRLLPLMLVFSVCLAAGAGPAGAAATITVVNNDGAGEGFNDPTVVAPVGGNSGTTLGAQRLNAFEFAAEIWADLIASDVEIRVAAEFNPLLCDPNVGAVLGQAGAGGGRSATSSGPPWRRPIIPMPSRISLRGPISSRASTRLVPSSIAPLGRRVRYRSTGTTGSMPVRDSTRSTS